MSKGHTLEIFSTGNVDLWRSQSAASQFVAAALQLLKAIERKSSFADVEGRLHSGGPMRQSFASFHSPLLLDDIFLVSGPWCQVASAILHRPSGTSPDSALAC